MTIGYRNTAWLLVMLQTLHRQYSSNSQYLRVFEQEYHHYHHLESLWQHSQNLEYLFSVFLIPFLISSSCSLILKSYKKRNTCSQLLLCTQLVHSDYENHNTDLLMSWIINTDCSGNWNKLSTETILVESRRIPVVKIFLETSLYTLWFLYMTNVVNWRI